MRKEAKIITMHCPLNYGAVLQTYGLQSYLESLGLSTEVIDYVPEYIVYDQHLYYVGDDRFKKNFLTRIIYMLIKAPHKISRRRKFETFKKTELHLTMPFYTYQELADSNLDADYFFCGSDQIWNIVSGAYLDPSYFLQFVKDPSKRNSYAASGNLLINDDVVNKTFPMINQLHNVSMREDVTIKTIQPYINKKIVHVCDPVFLLNASKWRELAQHGPQFNEKRESYVLIYPMGKGGELVVTKGRELADRLKLPLYCISASQKKDARIDKVFNTDPYTFIHLFDNAKAVVTNSFHGTSFSIILEKQFWSCAAVGSNQRLISLLEKCGLQERIISNETTLDYSVIDFNTVKSLLKPFVDSSMTYIKDIINE